MKSFLHCTFVLIVTSQLYAAPPVSTYYSKASGNWSDAATWTTSCGSAAAGAVPTASKDIVICSGYTVTVNSVEACTKITINSGGVLIIDTGGSLTITGDTEVDGTFVMLGGAFSSSQEFKVDASGTGYVTAGTFNLTGGNNEDLLIDGVFTQTGGTVSVNHDTYVEFGGVLNIGGTASFTANGDVNMVYGAGGDINFTGGTFVIAGNFFNNIPDNVLNQTGGTIHFTGVGKEWRMKSPYNASAPALALFDGNTSLYLLAGGAWNFYDLTINAGKTLDQGNADTISVAGDWSNLSGTFIPETYSVKFNGTADQSVSGTSGTTFYNITVNNSGASGTDNVILGQPQTVSHVLTLTDGIVNTDAVNLLILTSMAATASNGGNAGSFVSGPMKWSLTDAATYVFPTGRAPSKWARIAVSDLTGSTNFTAEYFNAAYVSVDTSDLNIPLSAVSLKEYWDLHEENDAINAAVTLYWEDAAFSGITSCDPGGDLVVGHYNGTKWDDQGNSGGVTGSCSGTSAGTVKSGLQTSFSPFTFGSGEGAINPLPIELLSFNAKPNVNMVDLSWSTASELNNDYFTIEKTKDGVNFEIVGVIKGAGNSTSVLNYTSVDNRPYSRISYYRLKQTDYDGNFSYSELIMVSFEKASDFNINVYPNPNSGRAINMQIIGTSSEEVLVVVYDIMGNEMFSKVIITNESDSDVHAVDPSQKLPTGIYIISATSDQKIYNKRLIVN